MSGPTPSQTAGPFFHDALTSEDVIRRPLATGDMVTNDTTGTHIVIEGTVRDGAGQPVADAMLEFWQADATGRFYDGLSNSSFQGFGRVATDENGHYMVATVKPGAGDAAGDLAQAPHIVVAIFGRGIMRQLLTRIYFVDEAANAGDPVLRLVAAERRDTLIARTDSARGNYLFDIHLQGPAETVFFVQT